MVRSAWISCSGGIVLSTNPLALGIGSCHGAALVVLTLWPALSLYGELLGIVAVSVPIALGLYPAWTHRDWDLVTKSLGLLAATTGALPGGWLGFTASSGFVRDRHHQDRSCRSTQPRSDRR